MVVPRDLVVLLELSNSGPKVDSSRGVIAVNSLLVSVHGVRCGFVRAALGHESVHKPTQYALAAGVACVNTLSDLGLVFVVKQATWNSFGIGSVFLLCEGLNQRTDVGIKG
eukprot:COSAG02_NODE_6399_length_3599_cov_3.590857_3_plen_111_part_00